MTLNNFSYWERTSFIDNSDIIIIGSGLVGLSAALHLKRVQPNLKVLVLERGFLPMGASTKNAGFACFGTVAEQIAAIAKSSEEEVLQMVDYKWKGLQQLRGNLGDNNIDYQQNGGYELFMEKDGRKAGSCIGQIERLNELLKHVIGSSDIYAVADKKIATFGFKGVKRMICNRFEGQIDTGKMMLTLLKKVQGLGVLVLNNCEITAIEQQAKGIMLFSSQGNFKAAKVILATNAFASQLFPLLNVKPGRGQVLVTVPVPGLKLKGTYHFDEGYYYFRNVNGRVLFGGGRNLDFNTEQTFEFGQTDIVKANLLKYLNEIILPGQNVQVDYWWSGIMGFGDELMPVVKQLEANIFCAVRCNGMGIAMGSLVGKEVAEMVIENL